MLQDAIIHNTAPIAAPNETCAHAIITPAPMPVFPPTIPVLTPAFPSKTTLECASASNPPPFHPNIATLPPFPPPTRPIVRNPYKRSNQPPNVDAPLTNPNEDLIAKFDGLKKEIIALKIELTDTVAVCENEKIENNNLISSLRIENSELKNQIASVNKVDSPLKRKLADIYVDLQAKTNELTASNCKLAALQEKVDLEDRIREEKEKQVALEKKIEDRIAARLSLWEQLEKEKEEVRASERVVEAKRIVNLELSLREKENKGSKCCMM